MTERDGHAEYRHAQLRTSLKAEFDRTLDARINRFIEVNHQKMLANHHFTQASRECHECYRDGYFIAATMLAQAVAEGVLKFMVERNALVIERPDRDKRILALSNSGFLDTKSQEAFMRIFRSFRNDYHHMNPPVGSIDHQSLAKSNIQDLAAIERYVFHCDFDQGRVAPRFRQYWDFDERGMVSAHVNFT